MIARHRFPKIVASVRFDRFMGLLSVIAISGQVPISKAWRNLVTDNRFDGWITNVHLAAIVVRSKKNCVGPDLRLIYRWHGLRLAREPALYPGELRCVHGRQLHHRRADTRLVMNKLASQ